MMTTGHERELNGGVKCPVCHKRMSYVIDSRGTKTGKVRRRRECPCGKRFTTYEQIGRDDGDIIRRRIAAISELLQQLREDVEYTRTL